MRAGRAVGGALAALLAVWAVSAAGADAPKPTPAPAVVSKSAALPRAAVATKRKPTIGFQSNPVIGWVGKVTEFGIGCVVEGNEDKAVYKCPIDIYLDGTKFPGGGCAVTAIFDITPGASSCGFLVPQIPHGRHVLTARVPEGPLLAASAPVSVNFDVQRMPTRLTYSFVLGGSGAQVTFHLRQTKMSQGAEVDAGPVSGRTISVKANGIVKGTVQTDAMGTARFTLSAGGTLSQLMQPFFEGDLIYEPATAAPHQFNFAL